MKKIILLALILSIAGVSFGQELPVFKKEFKKKNQFKSFINKQTKDNKATLKTNRLKNEEYWVIDSTYYYLMEGSVWDNYGREYYSLRDEMLNVLESYFMINDETTGDVWQNYSKRFNDYFEDGVLQQAMVKLWDVAQSDWVDTSGYVEYDVYGNNVLTISEGQKIISSYVERSVLSNRIVQSWDAELRLWNNLEQYFYIYDNLGALYQYREEVWNETTNTWEKSLLNEYSNYDENGLPGNLLEMNWNSTLTDWENSKNYTLTFDAVGNLTELILETWDLAGSTWINSERVVSSFDASGNTTEDLLQIWDATGAIWQNDVKYTYTYDVNGELTKEFEQTYNIVDGVWVNSYQNLVTYDAQGNVTKYNEQEWDLVSTDWINKNNYEATYNSNGYVEHEVYQDWDNTLNEMVNFMQNFYYYDEYGVPSGILVQQIDEATSTWADYSKEEYYWSTETISGFNDLKNSIGINVYPNPTTGKIKIVAENEAQPTSASIYNLSGKKIKDVVLKTNHEISIDELKNGVYYFKINTTKGSLIKKVVKQ